MSSLQRSGVDTISVIFTLWSNYKARLADFVHNGIAAGEITWDQLSRSAVLFDLVPKLYQFIKRYNGLDLPAC
ncbi:MULTISPECIES: hypothetical protein [unclassified Pedobacter]|uniref:hypothetical protein n=1 Tax=unclassified Pedobacter TaxID=2628915 RepID=UPI001DF6BF48|nr:MULTISPECIES: hypothetical protein [unclassified Pedobacter]CAH0264377.1 hypothetical protein SRABI36_03555 [Pedobacter sp. Bi36]CAH0290881.1 hypothetical protein SRABI126_04049 [Pedobacter sp. Bi126]